MQDSRQTEMTQARRLRHKAQALPPSVRLARWALQRRRQALLRHIDLVHFTRGLSSEVERVDAALEALER